MRHPDFADPTDLAILAQAVDHHCTKYRIVDAEVRENIAARVIHAFQIGVTELDDIGTYLDDNIVRLGKI